MPLFTIEMDTSDMRQKMERLRANMTQEKYAQAMYGIFQRTGRHVSAILRKDLPQKYEVRAGDISAAVKDAQLTGMGANIGCRIPIVAPRGKLGSQYKASGGAHGWNSLRRKYRVKARIVKGRQSTLPVEWHSGKKPFRNLGSKLGGLSFARKNIHRGPILKLTGIAVPQMPMNLAQEQVQADIKDYLEKQMADRLRYLAISGR